MDIAGAEVLRQRLAQQEHWRQARAVQLGRQSSFDPDGYALESFRADVRYYRPQRRVEIQNGRSQVVTRRISKRLVEGVWQQDVVVVDSQRVA